MSWPYYKETTHKYYRMFDGTPMIVCGLDYYAVYSAIRCYRWNMVTCDECLKGRPITKRKKAKK